MTLTQLQQALNALPTKYGRLPVCIDKRTFSHPCESDGATILDVVSLEVKWIPLFDDDGGSKMNSKGWERGCLQVVLYGDLHTPLTGDNADIYRPSVEGFCANCGYKSETHDPSTHKCSLGLPKPLPATPQKVEKV